MDELKQPRRRPTYTEDFKRDAVKLVVVEGHSMNHAAKLVGVSYGSIRLWVDEFGPDRDEAVDEATTVGDLQDKRFLITCVAVDGIPTDRVRFSLELQDSAC